MNKVIVGAVLAVGVGIGGLAVAAPASADPQVTFDCSPCTGAPWTDFFNAVGPWEKIMDATNGDPTDGDGAWETGVKAVNGGAWEKAFPPAE